MVRLSKTGVKSAAIIANGDHQGLSALLPDLSAMDMIIAADGGADACMKIGMTPTLIIGDMDSISSAALRRFEKDGVPIIKHPADKDQSDLELALQAAVSRGAGRIAIYCAMGGRWDMTTSNIFLLMAPYLTNTTTIITDGCQHMRLLRGGEHAAFKGHRGDALSLVPMGTAARGVCATGVAWPLDGDVLYPWQARGVSNRLIGSTADITVSEGCLLCIHTEVATP